MKRILALLVTACMLMACVPMAAFGEEATASYEPTAQEIVLGGRAVSEEETHLTVGNTTKVDGSFFTNQFGNNTSDIDVRYMLHGYNPIVWDTQLDFITDPMVVESLTTATDNNGDSVYTFTLCSDLQWCDGSELTAEDYVFAYLLQASPAFAEICGDTDTWNYLAGFEAYASGESDCLQGVRLIDQYTFSVTIKAEYLPYFYELSLFFINLSPMEIIAPGCTVEDTANGARIVNIEEGDAIFTADLLRKTILDAKTGYLSHPTVTSGPYRMVSYNAKTGVVEFELNEYYKGNYEGVKPVINTVTLVPVNPEEAADKLASGEIGLINKAVSASMIDSLKALTGSGFEMQEYPRLGYGYLSFSTEKNGPQQFQKVRQAIACSFDTDAFVEEYLSGYGLTVDGYYGVGQWMTMAVGGDLRPLNISESEAAAWNELSMNLDHYTKDLDRALALLIEDGWTLNEKGEEFNADQDTLRYKDVDGTLMPLRITFAKTIGNKGADLAVSMLQESFAVLNAELVVEDAEFHDILLDHLRENNGERRWDMSFLATNFVSIFDPLIDFYYDENGAGTQNVGAIEDEELLELAWDLHKTQPHDTLTFLKRWIKFQERFNEVLPTMPIYSNYYYDVYTSALKNYHADSEINWPVALIYAYMTAE